MIALSNQQHFFTCRRQPPHFHARLTFFSLFLSPSFTMNDQDRNNEDEGEGNDPALMPAIESLDDYIRRYGLLDANGGESTLKNRR